MKFGDIHTELVALFQHSSSSILNESIEARGELVHAAAQVVESEVDRGQLVGHGHRIVGRSAHCRAEGWFEGSHRKFVRRQRVCSVLVFLACDVVCDNWRWCC
jgi:hypothetical protein